MRIFTSMCGAAALAVAASAWAIPEGPEPGTLEWQERETNNYAKTTEAPNEQVANPEFGARWQLQSFTNHQEWLDRALADPSWLGPPSGNSEVTPLAATWSQPATGDPTRYSDADGPNGADFYANEGEFQSVVYYDEGCARIAARVWSPRGWTSGDPLLPGVVIQNGSVQAPQTLYWWAAQALVRAGYVVMTFDPRGQGRSDFQTPSGEQGGNANSAVFFFGMVNAVDYFRSSPSELYAHNAACAGSYPTVVDDYNPFWDRIDPDRLGIAGHSLGASGISSVQGYPGSFFQFPDAEGENPVDTLVAWDALSANTEYPPRVPAMGQSGEYGLTPAPFSEPPDPEADKNAFRAYRDAGVPIFQFTIQGSTHYEWSLLPGFPATSWCPDTSTGSCLGGWGNPMAEHYTVAWMDRWLKLPGEPGYDDADARLLADADWCERLSFYLRSARAFPDRGGLAHGTEDLRADCLAGVVDLPAECAVEPLPESSCHVSTRPGSTKLSVRDRDDGRKDRIKWLWRRGDVTPLSDMGDPAGGATSYTLCVYDHSGGSAELAAGLTVPASGCASGACWEGDGRGFRYDDKSSSRDGLNKIELRAGDKPGKAKIKLLGRGAGLGFAGPALGLPFAQDPVLTVQLVNSEGACWTSEFAAPAPKNDLSKFSDRGD